MWALIKCGDFLDAGEFSARRGIFQDLLQDELIGAIREYGAALLSSGQPGYHFGDNSSAAASAASVSAATASSGAHTWDTVSTRPSVISSHEPDDVDDLSSADALSMAATHQEAALTKEAGLSMDSIFSPDAEIFPRLPDLHNDESALSRDLGQAIETRDYDKVHWLLDEFFDHVAIQEYSWLTELKQLGFSSLEITHELLEQAFHGSWILRPFESPCSEVSTAGYHQENCVHNFEPKLVVPDLENGAEFLDSDRMSTLGESIIINGTGIDVQEKQTLQPSSRSLCDDIESPSWSGSQSKRLQLTARQRIEYFCGLGGVRPGADGIMGMDRGAVSFQEDGSIASITLNGAYYGIISRCTLDVLDDLDRAAGELQRLGGCCDTFTVLVDSVSRDFIELHRIPFSTIRELRQLLLCLNSDGATSLIADLFAGMGCRVSDVDYVHRISLAVQFLALGLLSYSQAHCGPIQPFFVDISLRSIVLLGSRRLVPLNSSDTTRPTFTCHLVEMTCMGDMVGQSVLAFDWSRSSRIEGEATLALTPRKNLLASPEDLLDTWGPGSMAVSTDGSNMLYSVLVGGGTITSNGARTGSSTMPHLHWSKQVLDHSATLVAFPKNTKALIGATIFENTACQSATARLWESVPMLKEMGTFPSYWEVAERQLGLGIQGGQSAVAIFQVNQTWVKMMGITKKSVMLSQRAIYIGDLNNMFGVQVSICTGIARRVRLRDLLADLLPAYVSGLVVKPPLWDDLVKNSNVISALRGSDISQWLESLENAQRAEFGGLVFAMIYLLRDTGIDRKRDQFVIACVQSELPFQCFKIPCKKENYWTRMLIDSEDSATFAYVTKQCLETAALKCCRPSPSWSNSTALLGTAVSQDRMATTKALASSPALSKWSLKDDEAYLIGQPDKALYVQVKRPIGVDPHLLVSLSTIPPEFLKRLFRKDKLRRLREMKCYDTYAESVVISVGKAGADSQT